MMKLKGIDILCASEASTAICTNMEIVEASSSSSSPPSSDVQLGGRTLDRHNPIICDGRRNTATTSTNSLLTPPRDFNSHPPISPHQPISNAKKTSSKSIKKIKLKTPKPQNQEKESSFDVQSTDILRKNSFVPTDIVTRSFAKLSDLVAPPLPAGSARYLLGSDRRSQFFDGSPEFEAAVQAEDYKDVDTNGGEQESTCSATEASFSQPPKPTPSKQVVVLAVSLHCKGCEGKVRKHLSRMEGVTSFNIDYAAKKVTIEGDVTPVGVLASVSKLKHAKFWTSQPPPSPPPPPPRPLPPSPSAALTVASTSAPSETPDL